MFGVGTHDLINIYLDYRNNFVTVKGYANYYDLKIEYAEVLIHEASKEYKRLYR